MSKVMVPNLIEDGAVKRCSACTQIFDAKAPESLLRAFVEHVRTTHHPKQSPDVNQAARETAE